MRSELSSRAMKSELSSREGGSEFSSRERGYGLSSRGGELRWPRLYVVSNMCNPLVTSVCVIKLLSLEIMMTHFHLMSNTTFYFF